MQGKPKKETVSLSVRIDLAYFMRLLTILKTGKYLNVAAFIRDAVIEKIEREG